MDKKVQQVLVSSIDQVQIYAAEGSFITIIAEPSTLLPALLAQINDDVREKVEQDVLLTHLQVVAENTLNVTGKAGAMGIQKEFEVICKLVLNKEDQIIQLQVDDISVKGGFLVRKGFEMIEPKIRSMIEKSVKISLVDLIEKAQFSTTLPDSSQTVKIMVQKGTVHGMKIVQSDEKLRIQLDFSMQLFTGQA